MVPPPRKFLPKRNTSVSDAATLDMVSEPFVQSCSPQSEVKLMPNGILSTTPKSFCSDSTACSEETRDTQFSDNVDIEWSAIVAAPCAHPNAHGCMSEQGDQKIAMKVVMEDEQYSGLDSPRKGDRHRSYVDMDEASSELLRLREEAKIAREDARRDEERLAMMLEKEKENEATIQRLEATLAAKEKELAERKLASAEITEMAKTLQANQQQKVEEIFALMNSIDAQRMKRREERMHEKRSSWFFGATWIS